MFGVSISFLWKIECEIGSIFITPKKSCSRQICSNPPRLTAYDAKTSIEIVLPHNRHIHLTVLCQTVIRFIDTSHEHNTHEVMF